MKSTPEERKLRRRVCLFCKHAAGSHVRQTLGKFTGERGGCEYSRCKCVGFVPKGWKPKPGAGVSATAIKDLAKSAQTFQSGVA